jgi:hypothetical protein
MFSLIFALFFLLISVCAANQQSPYWPYYSYPYGAQQNGGFYQQQPSQQFRQFGAQYPPYQQPYSPFYNRYGGYSSPYSSPNSYYSYGTNSQQYQQQRLVNSPFLHSFYLFIFQSIRPIWFQLLSIWFLFPLRYPSISLLSVLLPRIPIRWDHVKC